MPKQIKKYFGYFLLTTITFLFLVGGLGLWRAPRVITAKYTLLYVMKEKNTSTQLLYANVTKRQTPINKKDSNKEYTKITHPLASFETDMILTEQKEITNDSIVYQFENGYIFFDDPIVDNLTLFTNPNPELVKELGYKEINIGESSNLTDSEFVKQMLNFTPVDTTIFNSNKEATLNHQFMIQKFFLTVAAKTINLTGELEQNQITYFTHNDLEFYQIDLASFKKDNLPNETTFLFIINQEKVHLMTIERSPELTQENIDIIVDSINLN